jgi:hypothetical protein
MIAAEDRDPLLTRLRNGVLVGLSTPPPMAPARANASNQAERDLRPAKIQQNICWRLTSVRRTEDRYSILGYSSTAAKHGIDQITALRDALIGKPWMRALPAP